MIFHLALCVLLAAWMIYADPGTESEHFEEDLVIRPLKDGRIGARFSFTTTLEDTSPRNPESLSGDDECMSPHPLERRSTLTPQASSALYPFPSHSRADSSGIWNHRTASLPERR